MIPRDIRVLAHARIGLLKQLAPVLRRAGPQHPHRREENQRRAETRKTIRKKLRHNADAIASLVMAHLEPKTKRHP